MPSTLIKGAKPKVPVESVNERIRGERNALGPDGRSRFLSWALRERSSISSSREKNLKAGYSSD
jgi:hypothetical protein